ncbi:hypothetical protein [Thalassospira mesophila]|uniref:Uncharacterized protein n=1 Tax=Thalassospira mesophila TaxID=1293891 RepID=A0A1Y2L3U9_9PROT|nr:hypothetical protein [Thalassospira mesophila]OSQ40495.1 hypothetical protein TMES_01550 [Thalassospira mesophila]
MRKLFLFCTLFFMNIQSFVLSTEIKGLLIPNITTLLTFIALAISAPKRFSSITVKLVLTFFLFFIWQSIAVVSQNIFTNHYSTLIRFLSDDSTFGIRNSVITQSAYLFTCIIFFLVLYHELKSNIEVDNVKKITKIGLLFYIAFGFYEFFYFIIFKNFGDFISNRITGDDFTYGLLQLYTISGQTLFRVKSLSGEPSMLAYTISPFMVYYFVLKEKTWIPCFILLMLSNSSTAIFGIAVLLFIIAKRSIYYVATSLTIASIAYIIFKNEANYIIESFLYKISGHGVSGTDRLNFFVAHFSSWLDSNFIEIFFGHGFGTVRSTDYLSTSLFNTGIFGFLTVTFLMLFPCNRLLRSGEEDKIAVSIALITSYIILMVSVPELFYFHIWYFSAFAWHYYYETKYAPIKFT